MSQKANVEINETNHILKARMERMKNGWAQYKCRSYYTPDFPTLRMQKQILLFVWGREKSGYDLDKMLNGAIPLGSAHTLMAKYIMREDEYGPQVFERKQGTPKAETLMGEAYLASVEHIHCLDTMYLNTVLSNRVQRNIGFDAPGMSLWTSERFRGKPRGIAYMYIANDEVVNMDTTGHTMKTELKLAMEQNDRDEEYYIW